MAFTSADGGFREYSSTITVEEDPTAADRYARDRAWEESRDEWDRPLVRNPSGALEGYRRASGFGAPLESPHKLDAWKLRQVLRGAVKDRTIRVRAARVMADLDSGVADKVKDAKKALDDLAQESMRVAGSMDKADIGTALHDVYERYDRGLPLGHVEDDFLADVREWQRLIADFQVLSIERIVVNHEFKVGGKLDRVARTRRPFVVRKARRKYKLRPARPAIVLPAAEVVIADAKTSGSMDFAGAKFGVQTFSYATATPYNPIAQCDEPWGHEPPSADWAAILHTPSGEGRGSIYWVDLRAAYQAACDAHTCHLWRNRHGKRLIAETPEPRHEHPALAAHFAELAACSSSVTDLGPLAAQANVCGVWDDVRERFSVRKAELLADLDLIDEAETAGALADAEQAAS